MLPPMPQTKATETIHVKVSDALYRRIKKVAAKEHRTINNLVFVAILEALSKRDGK